MFFRRFQIDYFASALYDTIENDKNLIFITNQIENRSTLGLYLSMSMLWKAMYRCVGEEKTICRLYPVRLNVFMFCWVWTECSQNLRNFIHRLREVKIRHQQWWLNRLGSIESLFRPHTIIIINSKIDFLNFLLLIQPSNLIDLTEKISSKKLNEEFDTILNFILLHSKIASLIFHYAQRSPRNNCYEEFFAYDVNLIKVLKEFLENTMTKAETMWRRENDNLNYLTVMVQREIVRLSICRICLICSFSDDRVFADRYIRIWYIVQKFATIVWANSIQIKMLMVIFEICKYPEWQMWPQSVQLWNKTSGNWNGIRAKLPKLEKNYKNLGNLKNTKNLK